MPFPTPPKLEAQARFDMQTILILTKDLMIQSNASAAARSEGFKLRACGSLQRLSERYREEESVAAVLVDLQTPELEIERLNQTLSQVQVLRTIAFAQHVEEELLANAQIENIDLVLTRGQFNHQLPQLVAELKSLS